MPPKSQRPDDLNFLVEALYDLLRSPNVADDNMEAANLVDVGNDLSRSVRKGMEQVAGSLDRVADAIGDLAAAVRESAGKRRP